MPSGIARLDVRRFVVFVLMHDRLIVIVVVSGETVLMFRMIVTNVRVRVQARHLASRGQQGDSHEQREQTVHALSVYGTTRWRSKRATRMPPGLTQPAWRIGWTMSQRRTVPAAPSVENRTLLPSSPTNGLLSATVLSYERRSRTAPHRIARRLDAGAKLLAARWPLGWPSAWPRSRSRSPHPHLAASV